MRRRERLLWAVSASAIGGVALLLAGLLLYLWRESLHSEEQRVGGLAAALGARTEQIILETRDLLAGFDQLPITRCSGEHLQALQVAAISRPWLRAIGHWRAAERLCGVGFLQAGELKPPHADRIYESGVIAWWPSRDTEVGGVQLFLIRYGDHDAAIDPRLLLAGGPLPDRQVGLWVEGLPFVRSPADAELPAPDSLALGVQIDRAGGRVLSRYAHHELLPIEVVAIEPLTSFWERQRSLLLAGIGLGLLLSLLWLGLLWRWSRRRLSLAGELREALAEGRIRPHYQPVVDLRSGRCTGAEALARWTRDGGEAVAPDTFIPIAEQAGLVPQVTLAILRQVIADLPALRRLQPELSVNVNLCPDDLRDDQFALTLADQLARAGLPAGAIKLEITERALINSDTARHMIQTFRQRGHQIAIDDFGTGYSSLSYLQTFELDVLKIDKAFVDAIGTAAATSQVIVHVIEMAHSLGLATVAEGVQSPEQVDWLRSHGVGYGQGYLYSPPLDAARFAAFLRQQGPR